MRLETIAIHAGGDVDAATGSVSPPIHLSTTFEHGPASEVLHGYLYTREGNPVQARLEQALAALEGGPAALAFASGMAAGSAYLQSLPRESHVLFHRDVYYALRIVGAEFLDRWGCQAEFVDMCDLGALRKAIRPNTRLVWMETPSNPLMDVVDIAAVAEIAHGAGAKLVVDGTFGTPVLQRPLELGADAVLHSSTKYFGGHSDVQGGALVFARRDPSRRADRAHPPRARRRGVALRLLARPARAAHASLPDRAALGERAGDRGGASRVTGRSTPSSTRVSPRTRATRWRGGR